MKTQKNKNRKTWVDLTDLLAWKGHFSGIQRVVYEYATRYAEDGAQFFIYDTTRGKFKVVSPAKLLTLAQSSALQPPRGQRAPVNRKEQLRKAYQSVFPAPFRMLLTPKARWLLHGYYSLIRKVPARSSVSMFSAEDTVVMLGAGWENEDMLQKLSRHKEHASFKFVHLWHDLLPLSQSHYFDKQLIARQYAYTKTALEMSDAIICVSRATQADVIEFAKSSGVRLTHTKLLLREGEDVFRTSTKQAPRLATQFIGSDKFIFSLGTIEVRKNHQLLYQVYKLAQQRGIKLPKLIIAGREGWLAHDFCYVLKNDQDVANQILVLNNASDSEVAWLFDNAQFTVYPSIAEGWGLPICESLAHGRLCLTCNVSSMPEVGGKLADYFSPFSTDECLALIAKYSNDSKELAKKQQEIKRHYQPYTWDESYKELQAFVEGL